MSEHASLAVTYTPKSKVDLQENHWIRVEQIKTDAETISVGEAAGIIDDIFGIDACDDGLSGGGEESAVTEDGTPEETPEEETVNEAIKDKILGKELCEQSDFWTAQVLVLRSHQQPGYSLRSDTADILATELIVETISETIDFGGGTSKDLTWPYAGDFSASIASEIEIKILGSTVNLGQKADKVKVRYRTAYERVQLRVPVEDDSTQNEDDTLNRPELPPAAVIAFWGDLATACELEPPDQDDSISQAELAALCNGSGGSSMNNAPLDCFESVEHYQMCNCSRDRINVWQEIVPAECPDKVLGGTYFVGAREEFNGFVECGGDDEAMVSRPAYYEGKCCEPVPAGKKLPRCRTTYAEYKGGHEIEGGSESWMELYGENTRLIAVLPSDGVCGEIVTEWDVQGKNCCAGVAELSVDPDTAPEVMADNSTSYITWLGGRGPYTVSTGSEGLYIEEIGRRSAQTAANVIVIRSTSICGMVAINIKDSCGQSATHRMRATKGRWVECTGEVPRCAGGAPDPVSVGAYLETVSGEYKLWFSRVGSIVSSGGCDPMVSNPVENCEAHCRTDMIANGGEPDSCGVWNTFIWIYIEGNCPAGTARTCGCQGVKPVENWRWVC